MLVLILAFLGIGLCTKCREYFDDKKDAKWREEHPDVNMPYWD
jgi:hypothetical protein